MEKGKIAAAVKCISVSIVFLGMAINGPSFAMGDVAWSGTISDHKIALVRHPNEPVPTFQLLVDGNIVLKDDNDMFVHVYGIYHGGGRTYLLLEEAPGGNACAAQYQAIDLTGQKPSVSAVFGSCAANPRVSVHNGTLTVVTPRFKMGREITTKFRGPTS